MPTTIRDWALDDQRAPVDVLARGMAGCSVPLALVVDDDPDVLEAVRLRLSSAGLKVWTENDGDGGLWAAKKLQPDVIVLDWLMPRRSGLEVCVAVRADPSLAAVPVVLLSARDGLADVEWGYAVGVSDYIVKPFTGPDLVRRVAAVLEHRAR